MAVKVDESINWEKASGRTAVSGPAVAAALAVSTFPLKWGSAPTTLAFNPDRQTTFHRVYEPDLETYTGPDPSFTVLEKKIGSGAYGTVHEALMRNGEGETRVAVKRTPVDKYGIPNILEATIMRSLYHPYLNAALAVSANDRELLIFQPLAISDLSKHTRDRPPFPPEVIRNWLYCITQAVNVLHTENIIHGDLKAANVLLFSDGAIRLADFTLSVKKWTPTMTFNKVACTGTHRPPECILAHPWGFPLDIWSLACTFVEIAYGYLLFPYQGVVLPLSTPEVFLDRSAPATNEMISHRALNAILAWGNANTPQSVDSSMFRFFPVEFRQPRMERILAEGCPLHSLIRSMLIIEPSQRPPIERVMLDSYFAGLVATKAILIRSETPKLNRAKLERFDEYLSHNVVDSPILRQLTRQIYIRCNAITSDNNVKIAACLHIAGKLINGKPTSDIHLPSQIFPVERNICHALGFRFLGLCDTTFPDEELMRASPIRN